MIYKFAIYVVTAGMFDLSSFKNFRTISNTGCPSPLKPKGGKNAHILPPYAIK